MFNITTISIITSPSKMTQNNDIRHYVTQHYKTEHNNTNNNNFVQLQFFTCVTDKKSS